jgi:hypothetical protein
MPDGKYRSIKYETSKRPKPVRVGMAACSFEQLHFATGLAVFATGTGN